MPSPKILVLSGSLRPRSHNALLAAWAVKELTLIDVETTRISLEDYPMPIYDPDEEIKSGTPQSAIKLKQMMTAHQGIFIATPEHNASVPAVLKNAIDWVSRVRERGDPAFSAFRNRAFAIASASSEQQGGLRGLAALRDILVLGCGALVIPEQVAVPQADAAFDDMDNPTPNALANALRMELARLVDMARMMA
jgi:chromate reductase, NAD(P)H dehydrogenase (quinone)